MTSHQMTLRIYKRFFLPVTCLVLLLAACSNARVNSVGDDQDEMESETVVFQNVAFEILESPQQLVMPHELRIDDFERGFVRYELVVNPQNEVINTCMVNLSLLSKSNERLLWYTGPCEPDAIPEYPLDVQKYIPWLTSRVAKVKFRVINREERNVKVTFRLNIK